MSDLNVVSEVLSLAQELVGKQGPIELNTGIYDHNIFLEEDRSAEDIVVLGEDKSEITFAQLIELFEQLDSLVDDLSDETERSYFFEGITKNSATSYSFNWGS
ncbi:hypothetical protein [Aliidiomarina celeris]|uniref:hypothetical protein n=1 Tax=Aliidiomarina celeris TaxID=2249428 RepID=UPI000DE92E3C|nr:hypothetical protein [Aliidiomarina celeris]